MRAPHHKYTCEEYLAFERGSPSKHEFFQGEIYAMAGGTADHALLTANMMLAVGSQLRGKLCRGYSSDLRIQVPETDLWTYPDLSVVCGDVQFASKDSKRETVINPTVLIEVTSNSTEDYDRGGKFENYQRIATLREYVLVSHREKRIEVFRRDADRWARTEATIGGRVRLESISAELVVDEIYDGVELA
jgi:Uma2 family endonuclease